MNSNSSACGPFVIASWIASAACCRDESGNAGSGSSNQQQRPAEAEKSGAGPERGRVGRDPNRQNNARHDHDDRGRVEPPVHQHSRRAPPVRRQHLQGLPTPWRALNQVFAVELWLRDVSMKGVGSS